jgi:hypothetical protein
MGTLAGIVRHAGKPVEDARIAFLPGAEHDEVLARGDVTTDEAGAFETRLLPGEYTVVVTPASSGLAMRKSVRIAAREQTHITIDLSDGAVEGRVTDRTTDQPVAGAWVTLAVEEEDAEDIIVDFDPADFFIGVHEDDAAALYQQPGQSRVRTDRDGRFRFRCVTAGSYGLTVRGGNGIAEKRTGVVVKDGRTTTVNVAMTPGLSLHVAIDADGREVDFVYGMLQLEASDPEKTRMILSRVGMNELVFNGLEPGRYALTVGHPATEGDTRVSVDVVAGRENKVTVRLEEK